MYALWYVQFDLDIWTAVKLLTQAIPTLGISKFVTFRVPKSHSPETNTKLKNRPKQINGNMLVSIPVINEYKWYVNYLCLSSPSHSEHSDTHLRYIGCSPTAFIGYRQSHICISFTSQHNFSSPLRVPHLNFKVVCTDSIRYLIKSKSIKLPTSFLPWYPKILPYIFYAVYRH